VDVDVEVEVEVDVESLSLSLEPQATVMVLMAIAAARPATTCIRRERRLSVIVGTQFLCVGRQCNKLKLGVPAQIQG
jgi:hypothetical protein